VGLLVGCAVDRFAERGEVVAADDGWDVVAHAVVAGERGGAAGLAQALDRLLAVRVRDEIVGAAVEGDHRHG
jgi:hypothetical protein